MNAKEWNFRSPSRGYALWLGRDLLGDLVLIRRWWGLTNRLGGQKTEVLADEEEAMLRVSNELSLRAKHGYTYIPA